MIIYKNNANIIEKILRTLIIFVITAAFILPLLTPTVFATSSVTISTADTIKGGDTFTAVVTFGGGNVGRVDAQLTYDTDMLTYISGGSSSGNSGYIQLKDAGTDGSVVFNIEFQALTEGDASIEVLTNEMYDLDEMMIEPVSASKTISIGVSLATRSFLPFKTITPFSKSRRSRDTNSSSTEAATRSSYTTTVGSRALTRLTKKDS